ncbi:hypothetical protein GYMLUDRAFT_244824 [Collybiopsis luxurians FD-317 M1]|uniref:Uncharacterized protein n=1 Tax=Collybiopsis luxurians FD-317 M1 TaxID=944289 RepID=A0A0D0BWR6_9AGAR|nr:hypothetical protein GYMLUDRAFT_244824 [Collybiopsis luxurians FD-317 M1]
MSNLAPITAVLMPMPVSGTKDTPFFNGTCAKIFLKQVLELMSNVQSDTRKFNPDVTRKTWADVEAMLLQIYSAGYSKNPRLANKAEIDQYFQAFLAVSAPLCKETVITKTEQQYYFVQGLPLKDMKYVMMKLTNVKKKGATPPKISKVIGILNTD